MKKVFFIIVCFLLFTDCKKYNESNDDLSGDLYLRGRAFLYNDLTVSEIKAATSSEVKIGYARDSMNNYLQRAVTDTSGYFLFENLKENEVYIIFGEHEKEGVKFFAQFDTALIASVDSSSLIFKLSDKQNGIVYTVRDTMGGYVPNAAVCLFTSFVVANDTCVGSTYQLTTDAYGRASKTGIVAGNYISVFRAKFGNLTLKARDTIMNLPAQGILRRDVIIK